jgi:hypothetical protein
VQIFSTVATNAYILPVTKVFSSIITGWWDMHCAQEMINPYKVLVQKLEGKNTSWKMYL